ncbi:unnamed protein product, partial [Oppiella nova]
MKVNNDSADNLQNRLKFNEIEKWFDEEMPVVSIINEINTYDKCLNEIEMNRSAELLNATQKIRDPVSKITCLATKHPEVRHTMAVKWEQEIRRLALMCRHLSAFTGICDEDRMSLLKTGYREIIALRSLIAYNNDHRYWAVVLDSNNTTILKMETFKMIDENLFEIHKQFFTKFGGEWDFDTIILDLLTTIALFTPHRPD